MEPHHKNGIPLPAGTPWPMVLALGVTMIFAGIVTHYAVAIAGAALFLCAAVGWWRQVLPHEKHEAAPIETCPHLDSHPIQRAVDHLRVGELGHRVRVPAHIQPYSAGIKGGLAGAVSMAIVAMTYGVLQGSVWYPINLFAAAVVPDLSHATPQVLRSFHFDGLMAASVIHLSTSMLMGLLYAVTLPMFPRRAWLWAGVIAPLLWSGLVSSTLGVLNPMLNQLIDRRWFVVSQLAFGLVCGYIVAKAESIETMQSWPLAMRSGMESADTMGEGD
jgi:membrane-associated protease RseP (regulator of RpoE activity)